jgi:DNA ligase (NAD+)
VAEFEPTLIDGSIVSRASMHNYDIFNGWNLGLGDEIEVQKNNDIIPQIKSVVNHVGEKFKHPTHCPLCDTELVLETINTTNLKCPNLDCKCRALGNISKVIDKLNLNQKGLGDAFAEAYVAKYNDVYSLFTLTEETIKNLSDRYKDKSAKKIYDAIQSSKTCKLEDFFGLLNIEGCGSRTWKKVIEHFKCSTISHVVGLVYTEAIYSVGGIGESTVNSMRDGLLVKTNTIHELQGHLSILVEEAPVVSDLGSFLFTGSFSVKRSELEKMVVAKGGTIASSVNKDLKYLVQSDPTSTSSKSEKAKKLGIAIIGEDEFMGLIK